PLFNVSWPIFIYWLAGLASLIFSLIFIGPYLANFFPKVAILSYVRRIEYIVLFFITISTIKSLKDLKDYLIILSITILGFSIYGAGQHFYLNLWNTFPAFFERFSFCFPSFQTGNEEFAKGTPLCLPEGARVTSTFAGHYDLSAYLVLIIPILIGIFFTLKKSITGKLLFSLAILSIIILIFTSSRNAFFAYLGGLSFSLVLLKKKKYIVPFIVLSIVLMLIFSGSMAKRFAQTLRFVSVVTNNQGQVVGQADLSDELKRKLAKDKLILENIPTQNLPEGSGYIGLPQTGLQVSTTSALVRKGLSIEEARRLKLENGGVEITSVSGTFLVKKVLVYDISLTTRFQAEWPNAWRAFLRNPVFGSGFSTITLATDNDYLRMLGETGAFGFSSFMLIFIVFGLILKEALPKVSSPLAKGYLLGIAGGVFGLFLNAFLIDVFEASKVAETLWILLGIAMGVILLYKDKFSLGKSLKKIFTSHTFVMIYLAIVALTLFGPSIGAFFVGDDFSWLRWAANSTIQDLPRYFINSDGFFYRPITKTVVFFLWSLFSFQPYGYHLFSLLLHLLIGFAIYKVSFKLFNRKLIAFASSLIFLILPAQGETIYWFSAISVLLASFFIVYGLLALVKFRESKSLIFYILAFTLYLLALGSYEMGIIFPLLMIAVDVFMRAKKDKKFYWSYIPFVMMIPLYYIIRQVSNTVSVGGDYSYNLIHLPQNIIGNFMGYFGVFIFGERFFAIYDYARLILRQNTNMVLIFALFFLAIFIIFAYLNVNNFKKLLKDKNGRVLIFSLIFSFVSLLPFLGLGNISERYGYLSSVGYVFSLTVLIAWISGFVSRTFKNKNYQEYAVILLIILLGIFYWTQQIAIRNQWMKNGKITNRTLAYLRIYHEDIKKNSTMYFANIPTKQGQSWIFPVGLEDGVWFVYRDPTLKIVKLRDETEARRVRKDLTAAKKVNSYVFYFDRNGKFEEVK
ncbi:O-antigen ligase family protein, partial [Patescibacteria group bacterium]|nr:O-antigen ligase family protein [Patescibacteria group bacterium]